MINDHKKYGLLSLYVAHNKIDMLVSKKISFKIFWIVTISLVPTLETQSNGSTTNVFVKSFKMIWNLVEAIPEQR